MAQDDQGADATKTEETDSERNNSGSKAESPP
jgi:hypothetical protein